MCVPGALAAVGGVTFIAVHPAYRRRGILASTMRRQLDDMHDRGETLAALWASEAAIYGRFGYGRASRQAKFTIRRSEGAFIRDAPGRPAAAAAGGRAGHGAGRAGQGLRHAAAGPAGDVQPERGLVAADAQRPGGRAARGQPAALPAGRGQGQARAATRSTTGTGAGTTTPSCPTHGWTSGNSPATNPAASAALPADLLHRDLVRELVERGCARRRTTRCCTCWPTRGGPAPRWRAGLWVRVVDVPGALSLRRYPCPVDVVIDVIDDWCPWNQGRWRLTVPAPGAAASCARTSEPADLILPVAALGAAYLGGTRLGTLAAAGLVTEQRAGALNALSAALTWDPAPWCPVIF